MMRVPFSLTVAGLAGAVVLPGTAVSPASAEPIFSQTPTITNSFLADADSGNMPRFADDFSLAADGTARSVTWRGIIIGAGTFDLPISFSLAILEDDNNFPGVAVSNTTATFNDMTGITDTGLTNSFGDPIYEFSADVQEAALVAGTQYWFALRGDTTADTDDTFFWATGGGNRAAFQNGTGSYNDGFFGPFYFVIDNEVVPEPASLGLALLAGTALLRRRVR